MDKSSGTGSYFPHDSNARNSEKLIRLRMKHKAAGYGVFFMILERLREESDYMSVRDYNMLAFDLREDAGLIKSVIEDFGLFVFTPCGKYFYSESLRRRMLIKDEKSQRRSEAGKKGMAARYGNGKAASRKDGNSDNDDITEQEDSDSNDITKGTVSSNNVTTMLDDESNNAITKPENSVTSKGKESKEKKISKKEDEEEKVFVSPPLLELPELFEEMKRNASWAESLIMNKRHDGHKDFVQETLASYLEEFFRQLQNENRTTVNREEEYRHFSNWLNKKLEFKRNEKTKTDKRTNAQTTGQEYNYGYEIEPPHIIRL